MRDGSGLRHTGGTLKGHRKGLEFARHDLVSGEAALATALNASLKQNH